MFFQINSPKYKRGPGVRPEGGLRQAGPRHPNDLRLWEPRRRQQSDSGNDLPVTPTPWRRLLLLCPLKASFIVLNPVNEDSNVPELYEEHESG